MSELIDGTTIKIGKKDFVVPALNLKQIRTMLPKIQNMGAVSAGMVDTNQIDTMFEVILAAITRNYPEIDKEFLEENIDANNAEIIIKAIMGKSGLVKTSGEAAAGNL